MSRLDSVTALVRPAILGVLLFIMTFSTVAAASYNRNNSLTYAHQWSNNCNAFEGDTGCSIVRNTNDWHQYVSYAGNDCANFISQVMQAGGGLGQITSYWNSSGPDPSDPRNWFWNSGEQTYIDKSDSWVNVVALRNHAYQYLNHRFQAKTYFFQVDPGGFFVWDNEAPYSGLPTHGRVILDDGFDVETGVYSQLIASHTAERENIQYSRYWNPNLMPNVWKIHVCDDPGDGSPC